MTVRTGIGWNAEDQKKGMTLKELRELITAAMKLDIADETRVRVQLGWSGQVRQLRLEEVES